jgi:anti-anti-sigma factor
VEAFKLTEKELHPGCLEIQVEGELDLAVADQLQEILDRVVDEYARVLINLENCEFIDSTGIALVLRAHHQMAKQGRCLALYGPSSQVLRTLSITGLTNNGLVFESAEDALLAAAKAGC